MHGEELITWIASVACSFISTHPPHDFLRLLFAFLFFLVTSRTAAPSWRLTLYFVPYGTEADKVRTFLLNKENEYVY